MEGHRGQLKVTVRHQWEVIEVSGRSQLGIVGGHRGQWEVIGVS